jgi:hypothetical protein
MIGNVGRGGTDMAAVSGGHVVVSREVVRPTSDGGGMMSGQSAMVSNRYSERLGAVVMN